MSKTSLATNDALTKKVWEEALFRDAVKESYWTKFEGKDSNAAVQVKSNLEKDRGDEMTIGLRVRLAGAGVTEGQILEGNEERLNHYSMKLLLKQYRHAVRDDGEMTRKRATYNVSEESRLAIKDWMAEKVDQLKFDEMGLGVGTTTEPSKIFYKTGASTFLATGTAGTAKAALHATDSKLTLSFISFLKTWAQTGGNRQYIPIRPVSTDGGKYYVLLTHNDALFDLRQTSEFQQAQREAQERGKNNPLFTGAVAVWDNVVIHAHENCEIRTDGGGASVPWARGALFGAQALCWAWGKRPELVTRDFDYGNEEGTAMNMICAVKKSKFNSLDYGSIGVYLSRTNVSGA